MYDYQKELNQFTPEFDGGAHHRARIAFMAVANAGLTEYDMFLMCPQNIGLHFTRLKMDKETTISNLASTENEIEYALSTLMPGRDDVDVISYNCTSGSLIIGEEKIINKIESMRPNVVGTTMLSGVNTALNTMGVKRLVVGTPYIKEINDLEQEYLERKGFDVLQIHGLGLRTGKEKNMLSPKSLIKYALLLDRPEADAIFLSCGAIRGVEVIDEIERVVKKPVITSNQASFWNCLRLAGIKDRISGYGRLLEYY